MVEAAGAKILARDKHNLGIIDSRHRGRIRSSVKYGQLGNGTARAFDSQYLFASRRGSFEDTDSPGGNDKQSGTGFALAEQHFTGGKTAHHRTCGKRIQLRL